MSADVKWIKINTNILDDNKMKLIDTLPEADAIFRIWVGILSLAGQCNKQGMIFLSENIPYSDEMLSTIFNRPVSIVRLALQALCDFEMLEIFDNGVIFISNWEKHQNLDKLEKIKEQGRIRAQKHRAKAKKKDNAIITLRNVTDKTRLDKIRLEENIKKEAKASEQALFELSPDKDVKPVKSKKKPSNPDLKHIRDFYRDELFKKTGVKSDYRFGRDDAIFNKYLKNYDQDIIEKVLLLYFDNDWGKKCGYTVTGLQVVFQKLLIDVKKKVGGKGFGFKN